METDLAEEVEVVELNCRGCLRGLSVPVADYEAVEEARRNSGGDALGKMYEGFYVSGESALRGNSGFYCDESCQTFFTED